MEIILGSRDQHFKHLKFPTNVNNCLFSRILRNKIGSLGGHSLHGGGGQYPAKQPSTPALQASSAAAMAYSGLYQHFPPYTPAPVSSPPPPPASSAPNNNNNNNTSTAAREPHCSPAKSEPGAEQQSGGHAHSSHGPAPATVSPSCYKWSGGGGGQEGGRGGGGAELLAPVFPSYEQHHQAQAAAAHNLNYYMYLQSQSMSQGAAQHLSSHYNNSIPNNI